MLLSQFQANALCRKVVDSLLDWPVLIQALQSGGLEIKARGVIGAALEDFLVANEFDGLHVLPEYRGIDFAVIAPDVGGSFLNVDTVFEVKTNYASQTVEISNRLPSAISQAYRYLDRVSAQDAYVLYIISAPTARGVGLGNIPERLRDAGWVYWNSSIACAIEGVEDLVKECDSQIIGYASSDEQEPLLYCVLIRGSITI